MPQIAIQVGYQQRGDVYMLDEITKGDAGPHFLSLISKGVYNEFNLGKSS